MLHVKVVEYYSLKQVHYRCINHDELSLAHSLADWQYLRTAKESQLLTNHS
jgi:hypothetical protein